MAEAMVKQATKSMTSSKASRRIKLYEIRGVVRYHARAPNIEGISNEQMDYEGGTSSYVLHGKFSSEVLVSVLWKEPPHMVLANIRASDPAGALQLQYGGSPPDRREVQAFIRRYGVLRYRADSPRIDPSEAATLAQTPEHDFAVSSDEVAGAQSLLRRGWDGDPAAVSEIQHAAESSVTVSVPASEYEKPENGAVVKLIANDLWNFLCILFMRDYATGKIGKCAHPECPAPYFVKRRRTQTVCEVGTCSAWAQRKYALRWWNEEGQKRRAKKVKTMLKRKR